MLFNAFSNPNFGKLILPGAGIIWLSGTFFLLDSSGIESEIALSDGFFFSLLFVGGIWILDRVFGLFSPKGKNLWLVFLVPVALSSLSIWTHQFLLKWWFEEETVYWELLENSRNLRWMVLGLADQLIAFLALAVSKIEQQEELNKREAKMLQLSKDAELAQLRQQLQPHFLFNSLNSINALVVAQPEKAREMVILLSDFLRGTIRKDTTTKISLQEELDYLRMYLEIEKVRFGHRLQVSMTINEKVLGAKIPPLLIQPLLENAIKYGLYGVTGEVGIDLSAHEQEKYLIVRISNPYDSEVTTEAGTGFGLSSVERRLYLLFGRNDLLKKKHSDGRFSVELKIPQFQ